MGKNMDGEPKIAFPSIKTTYFMDVSIFYETRVGKFSDPYSVTH